MVGAARADHALSAPDFTPTNKNLSGLLGRWGALSRNFASLFRGVLPVVVVDRFRDDDEGSVWSMEVLGPAAVGGELPACMLANLGDSVELELLALSVRVPGLFNLAGLVVCDLFTPIDPYNPVVNNAAGLFIPGLITNAPFTFGVARGLSGSNPVVNSPGGFTFDLPIQLTETGSTPDRNIVLGRVLSFDPPIRVYRDGQLAVQLRAAFPNFACSFLYRERPTRTPIR